MNASMQTHTDIDRIRAWVEGTLPEAEVASLRARLAADPELAAFAAAYRTVVAATAGEGPAPACPLRFEDLHLDAPPARPWWARPAAAIAASVLLAAGAGLFLALREGKSGSGIEPVSDSGPVALATIPLSPVTVPVLPAVPELLSTYRPADETSLRFVEGDLAVARTMARTASRPLLMFVHHPTCPTCLEYAKGPFLDPAVREAAAPFVLAKASVLDVPASLYEDEKVGWPIFLLFTVDEAGERRVHAFGDYHEAKELAALLTQAAAKSAPAVAGKPLDWDATNRLAAELLAAEKATDAAAQAAAYAKVSSADPAGGLGAVARARIAKQRESARLALEAAREIATRGGAHGAVDAVRALDDALPRFAGTPYEGDLRRVRDRLARDGKFPDLLALPSQETPR